MPRCASQTLSTVCCKGNPCHCGNHNIMGYGTNPRRRALLQRSAEAEMARNGSRRLRPQVQSVIVLLERMFCPRDSCSARLFTACATYPTSRSVLYGWVLWYEIRSPSNFTAVGCHGWSNTPQWTQFSIIVSHSRLL